MAAGDDRIRMYYLFRAVTSFSMWLPFWTLWAYVNIESFFLLAVVDAAFWTTMIVFQVPTGLLGDRYGRRLMLFIGEAFFALGVLIFGLSTEFWELFVSNVVWAIGVCFIVSGDTPFLYDTLVELNRAKEFIGVMAKGWYVMGLMNAVACVAGGILVEYIVPGRIDLTLLFSAVIAIGGSFVALLLKEPKVDRSQMGSYRKHLSVGWRHVISTRAILVLILFQIVIEIAAYVMAVFRSVYMNEDLKLSYFQIGGFFATFALFGGFMAIKAGQIEQRLGEKRSLLFLLMTVLMSFTVVFLVDSPIAIIVQYPMYAVGYLQGPIISGYINKRVDSEHRSTIVAISSLMFTLLLTLVELPAGWIATGWGVRNTMMILAIAVMPIGFYLLTLWNREVDASAHTKRTRTLKRF
jgi:MFS family permease